MDWAEPVTGKALLVVDPMTAATDVTVVATPVDETLEVEPADRRLVTGFRRFDGSAALDSDEGAAAVETIVAAGPVDVAAKDSTLPGLPVNPRRSVRVETGLAELVVTAAVGVELTDALDVTAGVVDTVAAAAVAVDPKRSARVETGLAELAVTAAVGVELTDALDVTAGVVDAVAVAAVAVDPRRSARVETGLAELVVTAAVGVELTDALDVTAGVVDTGAAAAVAVDPRRSARVETGLAELVAAAAVGVELTDALDVTAGVVDTLDAVVDTGAAAVAVDPRRSARVETGLAELVAAAAVGVELTGALDVAAGVVDAGAAAAWPSTPGDRRGSRRGWSSWWQRQQWG